MKKLLSLALVLAMMLTFASFPAVAESAEPVKITLYYSDNATLPFQEDWLTVKTIEERFNVDLTFEVIPIADYATKVSTALNVGGNTVPDVILYQTTKGENGSLALNGADAHQRLQRLDPQLQRPRGGVRPAKRHRRA